MSKKSLTSHDFEFRSDFEAPHIPVEEGPDTVRISAPELAALLEEAREHGAQMRDDGRVAEAGEKVEALQVRLQGALDDLVALTRHVERLVERGQADAAAEALRPVAQRLVDGQSDMFARRADFEAERAGLFETDGES